MPDTRLATDQNKALKNVAALAKLMDSQFKVPGTDFRFGLESIVGLLPVGGDAVGFRGLGGSGADDGASRGESAARGPDADQRHH